MDSSAHDALQELPPARGSLFWIEKKYEKRENNIFVFKCFVRVVVVVASTSAKLRCRFSVLRCCGLSLNDINRRRKTHVLKVLNMYNIDVIIMGSLCILYQH